MMFLNSTSKKLYRHLAFQESHPIDLYKTEKNKFKLCLNIPHNNYSQEYTFFQDNL